MTWIKKGRYKHAVEYLDSRISLDIETSDFKDGSIVYNWAICMDGEFFNFRYFDELNEWLDSVKYYNEINDMVFDGNCEEEPPSRFIVIYIHNLAFEWTFMKHNFEWSNVFTRGGKASVIRARTMCGIEFRCSYALTNESLQSIGKEVGVPKVKDLDYKLARHPETELTEQEMRYIKDDVVIMDLKLKKLLENDTIATIPMTSTGYVRRDVRKHTLKDKSYKSLIKRLIMSEHDYKWSRQAFQGGYTHANYKMSGKIHENVMAYDLASSYPAVMVRKKFPMSPFIDRVLPTNQLEFDNLIDKYCLLIDVEFYDIKGEYGFNYISSSKCIKSDAIVADNGRVLAADMVRMIITEVDYKIITRNYSIGETHIKAIKYAKSDYLPEPLVSKILSYYGDKTALKGLDSQKELYDLSKALLNGVYGMSATDPIRDSYEWSEIERDLIPVDATLSEQIDTMNESYNRFLYYPWGCWVTAHARSELMTTIMNLEDIGTKVIYTDTDSIYYVYSKEADKVIQKRNDSIIEETKPSMEARDLSYDLAQPANKDGVHFPIGVWEDDTKGKLIDRFKTLGAKRYIKDHDGEVTITVSGMSKLVSDLFNDGTYTMEDFADGLVIPKEVSYKNSVRRFSHKVRGLMEDHNGLVHEVEQTGGTVITPIDAVLNLSPEYLTLLKLELDA